MRVRVTAVVSTTWGGFGFDRHLLGPLFADLRRVCFGFFLRCIGDEGIGIGRIAASASSDCCPSALASPSSPCTSSSSTVAASGAPTAASKVSSE